MKSNDPILYNLAKEFVKRGHVVWDVGANVGLFSFAAAHLAGPSGRIYSIEPDVWLVQLLRRSSSAQVSSSASVQIIPVAVAEACGLRTFNIASRARSANYLSGYGSPQTGGAAEQQTVVSITLDWLAKHLPLPDVIKIDVEGAELEVLGGGIGVLGEKRPVILCEVFSDHSPQVTALLKSMGYRIYDGGVPSGQRRELQAAPYETIAIAVEQDVAPDPAP